MNDPDNPGDKLNLLHQRYASKLPELLQQIEISWTQVVDSHWSPDSLAALLQLIHRIAGSSAAFNYHQISATAKMAENTLHEMVENPIGATSEMQARLETQLDLLRAAFNAGEQSAPMELDRGTDSQALRDARSRQEIYLVEDDWLQAEEIAEQISYFGYTIKVFTALPDLVEAVRLAPPRAILIDVIFPEGFTAGPEAMIHLQKELPFLPPLIFISESGSLKSRLQAVRAGGEAYFTKPVDMGLLVEALDQLTVEERQEPCSVLIVDDSPEQSASIARGLQHAGMSTYILHDPFEIMTPLETFQPNVILMNTYLPGLTGPELSKVIRQIERYVITPILYLSAEEDLKKQLDTLISNSEDFVSRQVSAERLRNIVRARIDRFRQLRSLMVRDSLTGLYNHTTIKERLDQELSRASRQKSCLSFAMLDLDHFKRVNDTYGHSAGDRVLKSLARFLLQRLRKSDVVGRYGGEEFCVILPDTPLPNARALFDELRMGFSRVHHRGGSQDFTVKLSVGVASYPEYRGPTALLEAADQALYQAKNQGRNQVVTAGQP